MSANSSQETDLIVPILSMDSIVQYWRLLDFFSDKKHNNLKACILIFTTILIFFNIL